MPERAPADGAPFVLRLRRLEDRPTPRPGGAAEPAGAPPPETPAPATGGAAVSPPAPAPAAGDTATAQAVARWAAVAVLHAAAGRDRMYLSLDDPRLGRLRLTVRVRGRRVELAARGSATAVAGLSQGRGFLAAELARRGLALSALLLAGAPGAGHHAGP